MLFSRSTALEGFDFTIHHWPDKNQGHVDELSRLPIEAIPPKGEEAALLVQMLSSEETTRQAAQEPHRATHVGGDALWKFFLDCFSFIGSKRICQEVARLCIQCQAGTDYGAMSMGLWDIVC